LYGPRTFLISRIRSAWPNAVTDAQSSEPECLRQRSGHQHGTAAQREVGEAIPAVFRVRLIDDHQPGCLRDDRFHCRARERLAGWIVGRAQVGDARSRLDHRGGIRIQSIGEGYRNGD
jgi:hypothetical protein